MTLPVGKAEIFEWYGWSAALYMGDDGRPKAAWERDMMKQFTLPAPMRLSWDRTVHIGKITLHKKAGPIIIAGLEDVYKAELWHVVDVYGGGYAWRTQRGSDKLSMHGLGGAIDIDPRRNQMGKPPEDTSLGGTPEGQIVVGLLEHRGITWGGRWKPRPDSMHVQIGSGY